MENNDTQSELPALPEPQGVVDERQAKQKAQVIEELKKVPIVEYACKRATIGRTTYYRWKKSDPDFAAKVDESLSEGTQMVSDLAESQLLNCIRDKELGAITFWLKHRHPAYFSKLEITAKTRKADEPLTDEEQALIDEALKLGGLGGQHGQNAGQNP